MTGLESPYCFASSRTNRTGMPIARALSLMYPDKPEYDYVTNTYMLGDSLRDILDPKSE